MSAAITIDRAGPLVTIQDSGRYGYLGDGISMSGPMDRGAFARAGDYIGATATSGLEITTTGIGFVYEGPPTLLGVSGGRFALTINRQHRSWDTAHPLRDGDAVSVAPGTWGLYGYVRFNADFDVPEILGSRATNTIVGLGGFEGRTIEAGDRLPLVPAVGEARSEGGGAIDQPIDEPFRFVWGIHAARFTQEILGRLPETSFLVSTKLNRMGVRLDDPAGVFSAERILSLVSDPIVPGDIQILGDGTPIVLMRDHQPTGGYPRVGTIVTADMDRFAQLRPGTPVRFTSVTVAHAHALMKEGHSKP